MAKITTSKLSSIKLNAIFGMWAARHAHYIYSSNRNRIIFDQFNTQRVVGFDGGGGYNGDGDDDGMYSESVKIF